MRMVGVHQPNERLIAFIRVYPSFRVCVSGHCVSMRCGWAPVNAACGGASVATAARPIIVLPAYT